jgi:hypothetical protein
MIATYLAEDKAHREGAALHLGCPSVDGDILIGFRKNLRTGVYSFVVEDLPSQEIFEVPSFKVDLKESPMDLRMALGTDLEFEENYAPDKYNAVGRCVGRIVSLEENHAVCVSKWGSNYCDRSALQLSSEYLECACVQLEHE